MERGPFQGMQSPSIYKSKPAACIVPKSGLVASVYATKSAEHACISHEEKSCRILYLLELEQSRPDLQSMCYNSKSWCFSPLATEMNTTDTEDVTDKKLLWQQWSADSSWLLTSHIGHQ